jgi:hypothetical protein
MTRRYLLLGLALALGSCPGTFAEPVGVERIAIGADLGTTAASAFVGSTAARLSVELPLSSSLALDLEPSFYAASGTGMSIAQVNAEALARCYLVSLFAKDQPRTARWGPYLAGGAVAAWSRETGGSVITILALGPEIRGGYRFVFGEAGLFVDPSVGYALLTGIRLEPDAKSFTMNGGLTLGMTIGWRFK